MWNSKKIITCVLCVLVIITVGFFELLGVLMNDGGHKRGKLVASPTNAATEAASTELDMPDTSSMTDAKTEQEELIDSIIENMTTEEKVGQLFFIKNDGRFDSSILESYPVGGIILFAGDLKNKSAEELTENIADFQEKSACPLLIGTDEEGGTVIRLSSYRALTPYPFQAPRTLYQNGGMEAIAEDTIVKSELLKSYGINVNFAPVCDVTPDYSSFMYNRAFGNNASEAAEYVSLVVENMKNSEIGTVLKHFPGYGSNPDTHTNIVRDRRSLDVFETSDLIPFEAGIAAGADCVLVCHNIVECMDTEMPASLSEPVHRLLRDELGFGGVIITDDLMMKGVADYVSVEEAAVSAVIAGNDMILSTNYDVQYNAVLAAVQDGRITIEQIEQSDRRILEWKYKLGLLE